MAEHQYDLHWLILVLGLVCILAGGFDLYWGILDIMTWINTFYFINVDHPLNTKLFFKEAEWIEIFLPTNPNFLNQPTDEYY